MVATVREGTARPGCRARMSGSPTASRVMCDNCNKCPFGTGKTGDGWRHFPDRCVPLAKLGFCGSTLDLGLRNSSRLVACNVWCRTQDNLRPFCLIGLLRGCQRSHLRIHKVDAHALQIGLAMTSALELEMHVPMGEHHQHRGNYEKNAPFDKGCPAAQKCDVKRPFGCQRQRCSREECACSALEARVLPSCGNCDHVSGVIVDWIARQPVVASMLQRDILRQSLSMSCLPYAYLTFGIFWNAVMLHALGPIQWVLLHMHVCHEAQT